MFQALIASRLITPPAIWGKLPGHADFVRSGMRHGESEGWQPWLAEHGGMASTPMMTDAPPAALVLPPGTLAFAPDRFVVGVITPSGDRVGRRHALLVYQLAHRRWVERHFAQHAMQSNDWLFWLARAVERHTGLARATEVNALERTVQALWKLHAPGWRTLVSRGQESSERVARRGALSEAALSQLAGPARPEDPGMRLQGVRYLPWADWPQRLFKARAENAFWQQDAAGGFVNASNRLAGLWESAA